ncbi:phosphotransferase [Saccharothrix texasensis]|uniref:Phosphotransferase family enzyme n=1 Tax=Saccharothrix texasensis TaxID=103734 RepID=A0A3N1GZZ7_9PSEU|nr:phosphotransferase [Saccharothrix texasensis]ROP35562.1 phosphotransferase family enzyme [Saccharothrix texasensis]
MRAPDAQRAVAAAVATATALDLAVDDVAVLHDSNKLTLRLLPCDALARVAPGEPHVARFEIDLARRLAASGSPVAALDPRVPPQVHERDGFAITLWTYYEPTTSDDVPPADYAHALARLHAGMRDVDLATPHFTDRVEQARRLVASREHTPALVEEDRRLLADALAGLRRSIGERAAPDQVLHGEPHPGNLVTTGHGPLFVDLETCCRGPVEFDLAHAPDAVADHYPGIDHDLLRQCRTLVLAMITAWRWDRDDQFPDGRRLAARWLDRLRTDLHPDLRR